MPDEKTKTATRTREQEREYRASHPSIYAEARRRYRESAKGQATERAHRQKYRAEHREEIAAYKRRYHHENREKVNAAQRAFQASHPGWKRDCRMRSKLKSPAYQMYVEWRRQPCAQCGIEDWRVVQAHHVDPSSKEFSVSELARLMESGLLEAELAKCTPLCANCHMILHHYEDLPAEFVAAIEEWAEPTLDGVAPNGFPCAPAVTI